MNINPAAIYQIPSTCIYQWNLTWNITSSLTLYTVNSSHTKILKYFQQNDASFISCQMFVYLLLPDSWPGLTRDSWPGLTDHLLQWNKIATFKHHFLEIRIICGCNQSTKLNTNNTLLTFTFVTRKKISKFYLVLFNFIYSSPNDHASSAKT